MKSPINKESSAFGTKKKHPTIEGTGKARGLQFCTCKLIWGDIVAVSFVQNMKHDEQGGTGVELKYRKMFLKEKAIEFGLL